MIGKFMNVMTSAIAPASYVIYPGQGLCVVSAHLNFTYDGVTYPAVEFRSVKSPASAMTKPVARLFESGVRAPADPADIEKGLKAVFSSRKKSAGGIWSKKKAAYDAHIASGDVRNLASVLRDIFSPHRKDSTPAPVNGKYSGEISISYSERQIVEKVLDLLGEEISLVTGLTETDTRQKLLQCALVPGYASRIFLPKDADILDRMEEGQFQAMFGRSSRQAAEAGHTLSVEKMKVRDPAPYTLQPALRTIREAKKPPRPAKEKSKPVKAARAPAPKLQPVNDNDMAEVRDDNRDLLLAELPYSAKPGSLRSLLLRSAKILAPDKFRIIAQSLLRAPADRASLEKIAADMDRPLDEVTALRKEAETILGLKLEASPPKPRAPISHARYARWEEAERRSATQKPPAEKTPRIIKTTLTKQDKILLGLPERNRASFSAESPNVSLRGLERGVFLKSAAILEPDEFRVFTQSVLRLRAQRVDYGTLAQEMNRSLEEIIEIRNRAAEQLRLSINPVGKLASYKFFKPDKLAVEKPPRTPKVKLTKDERFLADIPEHNRSTAAAELTHLSIGESTRSFFAVACKTLQSDELLILSQHAFRGLKSRLPMEKIAENLGIGVEEAILLRNRAAEKLDAATPDKTEKLAKGRIFHAYVPPVEKAPREPKPPRAPRLKLTSDERLLANIADHNRAVALEELPHLPKSKRMRRFFIQAGKVLQADEFSILSQHDLRARASRVKMAEIALAMGLSTEDAVIIRNNASKKFDESMPVKERRVLGYSAFRAYKPPKEKIPRARKAPRILKPVLTKEERFFARFSESNRAAAMNEARYVPGWAAMQGLYAAAGSALETNEFLILTQHDLRARKFRLPIDKIALDMGLSVEHVVEIRNNASKKLTAAMPKKGASIANHRAFFSYTPPAVKAPPEPKPLREPKVPRVPKPKLTRDERLLSRISEYNRSAASAELPFLPKGAIIRQVFLIAGKTLQPDEFLIVSQHGLRAQKSRMTMSQIAADRDISIEEAISLRNRASKNLDAAIPNKTERVSSVGVFRTYVPPVERTPSVSAPKPPRVSKPKLTKEERLLARMLEHNRSSAAAELPHLPKGAVIRHVFSIAGKTLQPNEFLIVSQHDLRARKSRMKLSQIAANQGISVEAAVSLRNRAAENLSAAIPDKSERVSKVGVFRAYVPPVEKPPRLPKQKPPKEDKTLLAIPEGNRSLFKSETLHAPLRGPMRGIFIAAFSSLEGAGLKILSQHDLRLRERRKSIQDIAADMGIGVEEVVSLRNAAAAKLDAAMPDKNKMIVTQSAFRAYVPPVERMPSMRAIKEPRAPKARILKENKTILGIPEENRGVFRAENPWAAERGVMRGLFLIAARTLKADEFLVVSQGELRPLSSRKTMEQIAVDMGLGVRDVIALRNSAAAKLNAATPGKDGRYAQYGVFHPYQAPEARKSVIESPRVQSKRVSKELNSPRVEPVSIDTHVPAEVPVANRALYAAEMQYMGGKGGARSMLMSAAKALGPEEFQVIAQTLLRPSADKVSLAQLAVDMGKPLEEIAALRKAAEKAIGLGGVEPQRPAAPSPVSQPVSRPAPPVVAAVVPEAAPQAVVPPRVIPADVRAVMQREALKVPGLHRALFEQAAEHLSAGELSVFTMAKLRKQQERVPLQYQAKRDKAPLPRIIDLYNSAVSKLRAAFGEASSHVQSGMLDPHPVPTENGPQARGNTPL